MLGPHEQDVAPVAIGDDLILQVLLRVLAPDVRFQRVPEPRPLLAQPLADAPELGARLVAHVARRVDRPADVGDLGVEGRDAGGDGAEQGELARRGAPDGCGRLLDRLEEAGEPDECQRLERPALDGEGLERLLEVARCPQREPGALGLEAHGLGRQGERRLDAGRVGVGREIREPRPAQGRHGEIANHLDDPVELERPERAGMH